MDPKDYKFSAEETAADEGWIRSGKQLLIKGIFDPEEIITNPISTYWKYIMYSARKNRFGPKETVVNNSVRKKQ